MNYPTLPIGFQTGHPLEGPGSCVLFVEKTDPKSTLIRWGVPLTRLRRRPPQTPRLAVLVNGTLKQHPKTACDQEKEEVTNNKYLVWYSL